jgi:hypothetical protein
MLIKIVAKMLGSQKLRSTKFLTLYWPSVIDDREYFKKMCDGLVSQPFLEIFKIISNG